MPFGIGIWELLILLLVLLLVFGPKRLPEMGRQLGKGMREFKDSVSGSGKDDDEPTIDDLAELPPPAEASRPRRDPVARARHRLLALRPAMARRIVPRRLGHDEEASLVEHLTELRHRLVVCLLAIVPAFAVAYVFHDELILRLKGLLPEGTPLVTLGVTEPFTTSLKVSFYVAIAIVLPHHPLAGVGVPGARRRGRHAARDRRVRRPRHRVVRRRRHVLLHDRAAQGARRSWSTTTPSSTSSRSARATTCRSSRSRCSPSGLAFQMPIFILGLVRLGVLSSDRLRRNRRIGYVLMLTFAILLPTIDPVSLALEVVPLFVLFEASIWLSVFMERRWERSAAV